MRKSFINLGLVLSLILAGAIGSADEKIKKIKEQSVAEIKVQLTKTQDLKDRFFLLSQLINKYASDPIVPDLANEIKESAKRLLEMNEKYKGNWNYGNAIHHSHLVLGRLALMAGNMEVSKSELMLAANIPGSPQLDTFGPNMTLAKELLEKGEKQVVLDYFKRCLVFWEDENAKASIEEWKADIAKGKIPDFKAHLVY